MENIVIIVMLLIVTLLFCACHPATQTPTEMVQGNNSTTAPSETPTDPPTDPPTNPPTEPPTDPPTEPPTQPSYDAPVLTSDVEDLIKSAFIAASSTEYGKDELRVEYYGEFEGAYIAFVDGPWDNNSMEGSEIVAGVEFRYRSSSRKLKVYRDGEKLSLQDALDAGWLSEASIHELWGYYKFVNG